MKKKQNQNLIKKIQKKFDKISSNFRSNIKELKKIFYNLFE